MKSDSSNMVNTDIPWSVRGGNYNDGNGTGVFYFHRNNGNQAESFRLV